MSNKIYKSKMKDENRLLGKIVNISLIALSIIFIIGHYEQLVNLQNRVFCSKKRCIYKKESCKQDSLPAAGRFSDTLPLRRSAILSGAFFVS